MVQMLRFARLQMLMEYCMHLMSSLMKNVTAFP